MTGASNMAILTASTHLLQVTARLDEALTQKDLRECDMVALRSAVLRTRREALRLAGRLAPESRR